MGIQFSCHSFQSSTPKTEKLFDAQGNLRRVKVPVAAAELMLEEPGYVVPRVDDLRKTRRIPAMRADDVLAEGKAYLLVPVSRVHCVVSEVEMGAIDAASKKKRKSKKRGGSRVLPAGNAASFIFPRRVNTIMSTARNLLVVMFLLASSIAYQAAARPLEEKPIFGASAEPLFPDQAGPVPPSNPSPCTHIPTPGNGHCNNHG